MQESVFSWGGLLIATGGSYKPPKCFYHLISFGWRPNGEWYYEANHELEQYDLRVPMPDGTTALIDHLPVTEAKQTLGVWTCPMGDASKGLTEMGRKCQAWIDRVKESGLNRHDTLFLSDKQMWPSVGHGLVSNTAAVRDLMVCLKNQYWRLAPLCGVIRTGRAGSGVLWHRPAPSNGRMHDCTNPRAFDALRLLLGARARPKNLCPGSHDGNRGLRSALPTKLQ